MTEPDDEKESQDAPASDAPDARGPADSPDVADNAAEPFEGRRAALLPTEGPGDDAVIPIPVDASAHQEPETLPDESPFGLRLAPGVVLGDRYELEERIGAGGMGVVFRAKDTRVGKAVAVKAMLGEFDSRSAASRRFVREARLMSRLTHPGVVKVLDFGTAGNNVAYLVLELLEGEPLEQVMQGRGPMPPELACSIACQVLATLSVIHDNGIVHCDLKPANIFLSEQDGQSIVKLLDFGLSKENRDSAARITMAGTVHGTPFYLAPELIGGERPTPRSDVYSAAVLLYEMLTGAYPFELEGERMPEVFAAVMMGERVRSAERCPDLPADLSAVVDRAVRIDDDGFDHAIRLLLEIDRTQGGRYQASELARAVPMSSSSLPPKR